VLGGKNAVTVFRDDKCAGNGGHGCALIFSVSAVTSNTP